MTTIHKTQYSCGHLLTDLLRAGRKKTVIKIHPCYCPPCRRRYNKEKAK